eukprot:1739334-Rhodomonas_salina.2
MSGTDLGMSGTDLHSKPHLPTPSLSPVLTYHKMTPSPDAKSSTDLPSPHAGCGTCCHPPSPSFPLYLPDPLSLSHTFHSVPPSPAQFELTPCREVAESARAVGCCRQEIAPPQARRVLTKS